MGWLSLILLVLLAVGGRLALAAWADNLVRQSRYDLALRLVPLLAISGVERSRFRADVLTDAGQYQEAERILRDILDQAHQRKATKLNKVKTCFDLEDLGNVLIETRRFDEALRCFRDASNTYPYHSVWATGIAEVLLRQGTFPERALEHAERALYMFRRGSERIGDSWRLGPILATKAWALAVCGHEAEAREAIGKALNSPARKTKGPLAQVHYKAGMSLLTLGEHRRAE